MITTRLYRYGLKESICSYFLIILTMSSVLIVPHKLCIAYANERFYSNHIDAFRNITDSPKPPLVIKDITFKLEKSGKEIVAIHANRRFKPTVFAIEQYPPRLVIDIKNVNTFRGDLSLIPVDGALIKRIRIHLHKYSKTLRVVLDNSASYKYYKVKQVFYEGNNVYVFEVIAKEDPSPKEKKEVNEIEADIED